MLGKSGIEDAAKVGGYDAGRVISMRSFDWDVPYKFRVLEPIVPMQRILYPCLVSDDKSSIGLRQSWRSIRVPIEYKPLNFKKEPTVVDMLAKIDLGLREAARGVGTVDEDLKSFFTTQKVWVMPVFDRRDTEGPNIKFLEAGWQIFNSIRELRAARDEDDQAMLSFGPHWVWDIVLKKIRKKPGANIPDRYNTVYTATTAKANPLAGRLPASIIDSKNQASLQELFDKSVEVGIFNEEEMIQIKMFSAEAEMIELYKPHTPQEIMTLFRNAPLCLDATNKDGSSIFPDPKEFARQMLEAEMACGLIESGIQVPSGQIAAAEEEALAGDPPEETTKKEEPKAKTKTKPTQSEALKGLVGGLEKGTEEKSTETVQKPVKKESTGKSKNSLAFLDDLEKV